MKMNRKNRVVTALAALLLFSTLILGGRSGETALAAYSAGAVRVFDDADLFTSSEEVKLQEDVAALAGDIQMDVAIATTANTYFMQTYEYAEYFYMEQGIGYGANRAGFLFLIDMDNREVYIDEYNASESGFELSTAERDKIFDRVMEYMYEGDYYGASARFVKELPKYVGNGTSGDADYWDAIENGEPEPAPTRLSWQYRFMQNLPVCAIGSLVVAGVVVAILYFNQKSGSKATAVDYQKGQIQVVRRIDRFQNTTVTKTKIETQTRTGGGGGSIGSSHHGGGHSGGGRKF